MRFILGVYIFICIVNPLRGFKIYTSLQKVVFTNLYDDEPDDVHSEYYFGKCSTKRKQLVVRIVKSYDDMIGKMIHRGWLPTFKAPQCVYLRARSPYADFVRYHSFKFNFCICTLVYTYRSSDHRKIYYEWYIPVELVKGIYWEIHFYV